MGEGAVQRCAAVSAETRLLGLLLVRRRSRPQSLPLRLRAERVEAVPVEGPHGVVERSRNSSVRERRRHSASRRPLTKASIYVKNVGPRQCPTRRRSTQAAWPGAGRQQEQLGIHLDSPAAASCSASLLDQLVDVFLAAPLAKRGPNCFASRATMCSSFVSGSEVSRWCHCWLVQQCYAGDSHS